MIALLKPHSLTVKSYFRAERFALNLSERQSTASITVGPEAPVIGVNDWLRDDKEPGAGIVWRVKTVDTDYATDTRTIQCEHLICGLRDLVMFGEVTPGNMAGNAKATKCTAKQAVQFILKKQEDWTLGSFGYDKEAPYNFNGDDLLSALETVSSSLLDAWWSYDFTEYPFKLNIKKKNTAVACEMRMDRNIRTLKKTIDRSRMYTRFYPIGKNNLKLGGGGYVSKNEKAYGVVCKVETDQDKDTTEKLKAWAEEKLNNHAEPTVTVTISGLDLSAATGESLDRLTLGKICRVPLPEFGTTITEIISRLSWGDKIADPESVSITLANQAEDVANIINNMQKSSGGGGKTAAKNDEEKHAWLVDEKEKVGLLAEAVAGPGADKDWSRVSRVFADGEGIHASVVKAQGDIIDQETRIEATEKGLNSTVRKGEIISEINQTAESITISASKIDLKGLVQNMKALEISVSSLEVTNGIDCRDISCSAIDCTGVGCQGDISCENMDCDTITMDSDTATWQQFTFNNIKKWGDYHFFLYASEQHSPTPTGSVYTKLPDTIESKTIYYLGKA